MVDLMSVRGIITVPLVDCGWTRILPQKNAAYTRKCHEITNELIVLTN